MQKRSCEKWFVTCIKKRVRTKFVVSMIVVLKDRVKRECYTTASAVYAKPNDRHMSVFSTGSE